MGSSEPTEAPTPAHSRCRDQKSLVGDVEIDSADELASLEGCQMIDGNLTIRDVSDLRPLHSLEQVTGRFEYWPNTAAAVTGSSPAPSAPSTLNGVESLERVGSLRLEGIASESLQPLHRLRELTGQGELMLNDCPNLRSLAGLESLAGLQTLHVHNAPLLKSLAPLQLPSIMDELHLGFLPQLEELRVQAVRSLSLLALTDLPMRDLSQFTSLAQASIYLASNANLENIDTLSQLDTLDVLHLNGNPKLTHLPALSPWQGLEHLIVENHASLTEIALPTEASTVGEFGEPYRAGSGQLGHLEVAFNPQLERLQVPARWRLAQFIRIEANPALVELDLNHLESIDRLELSNNARLTDVLLPALQSVDYLQATTNPGISAGTFAGVGTFLSHVDTPATP